MAIKKSVFNDLLSIFVDSIDVFDCRLPGVLSFCPFLKPTLSSEKSINLYPTTIFFLIIIEPRDVISNNVAF